MKTLHDHSLIYDKDCPLCAGYTSAFIKTGMLDSQGREAFSNMSEGTTIAIDLERAKDEIALVDRKTGIVTYGIDSMLKVIGHAFPLVKKIGNLSPIHFALKKLYAFISYNRKVIIPSKPSQDDTFECVPKFSYTYRWLYILMTLSITSLILHQYAGLLGDFIPPGNLYRELLIASVQLIAQSLMLFSFKKETIINYLGNMMTISFVGSLLLGLFILINQWFPVHEYMALFWFGMVFSLMLVEHVRRVSILELPKVLTFTWVLYRGIVLLLIL